MKTKIKQMTMSPPSANRHDGILEFRGTLTRNLSKPQGKAMNHICSVVGSQLACSTIFFTALYKINFLFFLVMMMTGIFSAIITGLCAYVFIFVKREAKKYILPVSILMGPCVIEGCKQFTYLMANQVKPAPLFSIDITTMLFHYQYYISAILIFLGAWTIMLNTPGQFAIKSYSNSSGHPQNENDHDTDH